MNMFPTPSISLHGSNETVAPSRLFSRIMTPSGPTGLGVAPMNLTFADLASGGGVLRHRRHTIPDVMVPVHLAGDYDQRWEDRRLLERLVEGEVEIRVTQPGGESRSRFGYYKDGLEGDYDSGQDSHDGQTIPLTFSCPDAFWHGARRCVEWELSAPLKPFLSHPIGGMASPFFPVILSPSTVEGARSILIHGDAPAQAVITVEGPGTDLVVENSTTGDRVMVEGLVGEPITIDAVKGDVYSASLTQGELWDQLSADSSPGLITLTPGVNLISVAMVDADPRSKVTLSYRERFLAGH